jgi:hypothetical protein
MVPRMARDAAGFRSPGRGYDTDLGRSTLGIALHRGGMRGNDGEVCHFGGWLLAWLFFLVVWRRARI